MRARSIVAGLVGGLLLLIANLAMAQQWLEATARKSGEGAGPFQRLILQQVTVVGAPASALVDVVIQSNRIVGVTRAQPKSGDRVIDARGLYVMPGLIDTHVRIVDAGYEALPPDYALKLLLAHGVTTIASMQSFDKVDWALRLQKQSAANTIVAPRIQVWSDVAGETPEEIRANIRSARQRGVFGIGEGSIYEDNVDGMRAALDETSKLRMRSQWHMYGGTAVQFNALDAARAGLGGLTHWYCLPEALLEGRVPPKFPETDAPRDTRLRFAQAGRLWKQTAAPFSPQWNQVMNEFLARDFTFEPTFSVYEAHRDYMGVSRADWHDAYLHPVLEKTFIPGKTGRFSHLYDWTSTDEVEWRNNYRLWMTFINEYKNRGGRVVAGADAGFMWVNFGFGLIRNLEMLQEAGFTTREALDAATIKSAEHLGMQSQVGSIEVGKLADLVLLERDPLNDLKTFYGTGTLSLQPDGSTRRTGGVKYTIKDGVIYDAKALLADVANMVRDAREAQRGVQ